MTPSRYLRRQRGKFKQVVNILFLYCCVTNKVVFCCFFLKRKKNNLQNKHEGCSWVSKLKFKL